MSPIGFLNVISLSEGETVNYYFQMVMNFKSAKWENSTFKGIDFNFF